jgi:deoxyribodipyrimidine photolyase
MCHFKTDFSHEKKMGKVWDEVKYCSAKMQKKQKGLVWFRNDLRVHDNESDNAIDEK